MVILSALLAATKPNAARGCEESSIFNFSIFINASNKDEQYPKAQYAGVLMIGLDSRFAPRLVRVGEFEGKDKRPLVNRTARELRTRANNDETGCYGYFPGVNFPGVEHNLPASIALADAVPKVQVEELVASFSWLRFAVTPQFGYGEFHLDANSGSGVGDMSEKTCWRVVVNLSTEPRALRYLNVDPTSIDLKNVGNHRYSEGVLPDEYKARLDIPGHSRKGFFGAVLAVNRVLHSGADTEQGHFLASYGVES